MQAALSRYKISAQSWDCSTRQCCGAAQWVAQRTAASFHALAAFYEQVTQQVGVGATCSRLAA